MNRNIPFFKSFGEKLARDWSINIPLTCASMPDGSWNKGHKNFTFTVISTWNYSHQYDFGSSREIFWLYNLSSIHTINKNQKRPSTPLGTTKYYFKFFSSSSVTKFHQIHSFMTLRSELFDYSTKIDLQTFDRNKSYHRLWKITLPKDFFDNIYSSQNSRDT